jgi:soluble lytic murein transglycosylase-like protein
MLTNYLNSVHRIYFALLAVTALPFTVSTSVYGEPSATFDDCFETAANRYAVSADLLRAIATAESAGDPNAQTVYDDGTTDTGLMQINSFWHGKIAAFGIEPHDLFDPCVSIHIGAWILAQEIQRFGYTWEAVGAYNAGPSTDPDRQQRRLRYAHRVYRFLR